MVCNSRFFRRGPRGLVFGLLLSGMVCALSYWIVPNNAAAQTTAGSLSVRYFQQLRQRRLFSVAEQLGMEQLGDPLISAEEFIQISVELSKTYAEHARFTSGEEHEQYWKFAESVLEEALAKHRRHPRSLLLEIQRAFLPAERGEFLRGQMELFPYDQPLAKQAQEVFQSALERLKPLESELAQRHRQLVLKKQRGPGELATFEIHDLHDETRFQLGCTLQEFAQTRANFTGERTMLLKEAYVWLKLLSEAKSGDAFQLPATIRLAENHRLRDDLNGADVLLKELEEDPIPADWEAALTAERVRWFLAKGKLAEAIARLKEFRKDAWRDTGELAFLNAEVLLRQWEAAEAVKDAGKIERLSQEIETLIKPLETKLGGYWGYRISLLKEQLQQAQKYGTPAAALVRRAEASYAAGDMNSAAADYHQSAELALKAGKPDIAFDLGYTRASLLIQTRQFAEAAAALHQLSEDFPQNNRAPNAHLLEGYCLGKLYEADPTEPRRVAYTNLLKEHVEKHPRHDTLGDAYWMLGQLEEQRLQNTMALTYYQKIPAGHRQGPAAQLAVARCYEKVIEFLHDQAATAEEDHRPAIKERAQEWEEAGARELSQLVEAYPKEPEPWNHAQADVALELARLQLTRTTPNYPRADSLLERILISGTQQQTEANSLPPGERDEWSRILKTSRQLRIVSLAGQGLSARAEMLVKQLSESSTEDVLGVMDGLMQVASKADPETRRKLGQLQLQTAVELNSRRQELDSAEQDRLDHCRAQAYLATNQPGEALKLYEQMLAGLPKSKPLYLRIAGLLRDTDDRQCLRKAKMLWRTLEAQEKPGSETWLERRYEVARCSWKLGETEEARKLLGVTKLLYPDFGNEELKLKFEQLEKAIAGKR